MIHEKEIKIIVERFGEMDCSGVGCLNVAGTAMPVGRLAFIPACREASAYVVALVRLLGRHTDSGNRHPEFISGSLVVLVKLQIDNARNVLPGDAETILNQVQDSMTNGN